MAARSCGYACTASRSTSAATGHSELEPMGISNASPPLGESESRMVRMLEGLVGDLGSDGMKLSSSYKQKTEAEIQKT